MAIITSYSHGCPSWVDLAAKDPEGAKKFYTRLFGWEFDDVPAGDTGEIYTMYKRQGQTVAASTKSDASRGRRAGRSILRSTMSTRLARW